ncbi:unnamed protein product, partial [Sphacelaria rigidula]
PLTKQQYVLSFIPLSENGHLCAVSKDFQDAAEADWIWRDAFLERFEKPSCRRFLESEMSGCSEDGTPDAETPTGRSSASTMAQRLVACSDTSSGGQKEIFMRRLKDPEVGDKVEVAWTGKFRLESLEVYSGMAWWRALIVAKGDKPGYYQVHYPGWESRWDEWVSLDRLRWGNDSRANTLQGKQPEVGDSVELWCEGVHVPGAWLEAQVLSIENGRLNLGELLTTGVFWVDATNVRVVK